MSGIWLYDEKSRPDNNYYQGAALINILLSNHERVGNAGEHECICRVIYGFYLLLDLYRPADVFLRRKVWFSLAGEFSDNHSSICIFNHVG